MCNQHQTRVLSVSHAKAKFEQTTIERRELRPHDVLIDIKFSGICHSDIHSAFDEWGGGIFPMVPGHEIAGVVQPLEQKSQSLLSGTALVSAVLLTLAENANTVSTERNNSARHLWRVQPKNRCH